VHLLMNIRPASLALRARISIAEIIVHE
jgi:hypothetical protein